MNKSPDFRNTLMEALGMKILPMKNGKYYASMPVDHRTVQIQGCLHGGASIALAETLAGYASSTLCSQEEFPVGISVTANHINTACAGTVIAEASPIKLGKRLHLWQVDILNDNKDILSTVRITNYLISHNS